MRYHIYKSSPKKALLIADSQARHLTFGNINILSVPGALTKDVSPFIPPPGKFDLIVLLIGGNDLYNGYHPSETSPNVVALRIADLAERVLNVTKKVFVIAVPPRFPTAHEQEFLQDHELIRHLAVNQKLEKLSKEARWKYRALSEHVYSVAHVSDRDNVHLNSEGISQIRVLLKTKVFYGDYSEQLASEGHPKVSECNRHSGCTCGSFFGRH